MCEAGRILHHLRYKMHNPKNTILIVGFMAQNTLGRRILEQGLAYEQSGRTGDPPILKLLNKEYPLKAQVVRLGGFSAHGDKNEMMRFLQESNLEVKRIAIVHGEEEQSLAFADQVAGQRIRCGCAPRGANHCGQLAPSRYWRTCRRIRIHDQPRTDTSGSILNGLNQTINFGSRVRAVIKATTMARLVKSPK